MPLAVKFIICVIIVLTLVWAGVLFRARSQELHAEERFPPEGQILDVAGHKVHAVVMGEGPDLVLIHGSSGNTRDMTFALAPRLAESFRVIIFDRPGLGYTDPINSKGASIAEQANLLSAVAKDLGADRPIVVGHSYGGAVALAWAVNHPDALSGLVTLSAASHPWKTGLSTYYKLLSSNLTGPVLSHLITTFVGEARINKEIIATFHPDAVPDGYVAHFGAGLTLRRASLRANALQRANLLSEIETLVPHYPEITVPVEILHGTHDKTVGLDIHSRPLRDAIPNAALTRLEDAGHMIQHTRIDAVIESVHRVASRAGLHPSH